MSKIQDKLRDLLTNHPRKVVAVVSAVLLAGGVVVDPTLLDALALIASVLI